MKTNNSISRFIISAILLEVLHKICFVNDKLLLKATTYININYYLPIYIYIYSCILWYTIDLIAALNTVSNHMFSNILNLKVLIIIIIVKF